MSHFSRNLRLWSVFFLILEVAQKVKVVLTTCNVNILEEALNFITSDRDLKLVFVFRKYILRPEYAVSNFSEI